MASKIAPRILITGSMGQIGSELIWKLRRKFGHANVVASDVRAPRGQTYGKFRPFRYCDVLDSTGLEKIAVEEGIDWIIHNSAMVSVAGEADPQRALNINITGVRNVLEMAKSLKLRVLIPSTIAVYGPDAPPDMTPEDVSLNPTTVYGISKLFMEQLGRYYQRRYGVDFRCLRYPGILSSETAPGGGTTDYAIHMLTAALMGEKYICPLKPDEALPMMMISDCLKATLMLLEADEDTLNRRVYNVSGFHYTPEQLAQEIQKHIPTFECEYQPDPRYQDIASSWPNSLDDAAAAADWEWRPTISFEQHVEVMLTELKKRLFEEPCKDYPEMDENQQPGTNA